MKTAMEIPEIGIVDTRRIKKILIDIYNTDFTDYALTAFKRRIGKILILHNLKNVDDLLAKLENNADFFDDFLFDYFVESTEMFRDPSLWRVLRDEFFPSILKIYKKFKIWLPSCISGEELFSLMILLEESGYTDNVEIIATVHTEKNLKLIKSGIIQNYKIPTSEENYKRFKGKYELSNYYSVKNNLTYRDTNLIKNVNFIKQNIIFDNSPDDINLILFRNQLIYFNQTLQDKVLNILYNQLAPNGFLITGAKELITGKHKDSNYILINEAESIYKKRNI